MPRTSYRLRARGPTIAGLLAILLGSDETALYEARGLAYRRTTSRLSKRGRNELRYAGQGAQRVPALDQRVALRVRTLTNQPGQNQRVWALGCAVAHYHQAREAKDLVEPTGGEL